MAQSGATGQGRAASRRLRPSGQCKVNPTSHAAMAASSTEMSGDTILISMLGRGVSSDFPRHLPRTPRRSVVCRPSVPSPPGTDWNASPPSWPESPATLAARFPRSRHRNKVAEPRPRFPDPTPSASEIAPQRACFPIRTMGKSVTTEGALTVGWWREPKHLFGCSVALPEQIHS